MIDAITFETAHLFSDALLQVHQLRHRIFVERQRYQVPTLRGMEWDEFDTPAAIYLVWRDANAQVRAVARLIPTSMPYMIRQLWPDLVNTSNLPCCEDVWELSRFGIDRDLDRATRERIMGEMMCALGEFAMRNNVRQFMFVTSNMIIEAAIRRAGVRVDVLGEPRKLGSIPVVAARLDVDPEGLEKVRRYYRMDGRVLRFGEDATTPTRQDTIPMPRHAPHGTDVRASERPAQLQGERVHRIAA